MTQKGAVDAARTPFSPADRPQLPPAQGRIGDGSPRFPSSQRGAPTREHPSQPEHPGRAEHTTEHPSPVYDPEAEFHAFFADNYKTLARFAYLLTGDHEVADDVTAEALTAAWRTWDRVRGAESPLAYVRRMVANIATSRLRRLVRERRAMTSVGSMADGPPPSTDVPAVIDVRAALMELPARKRACVVLRHAFDLSEEETATTLGISVGTVKSQTSKAVAELERLLDPDRARVGQSPGRKARQRGGTRSPSLKAAASPTGAAFSRLRDADGPNRPPTNHRPGHRTGRPLREEAV